MSGTIGNKNSVGNSGGKSLQDRVLASEVRSLTLTKIKTILDRPAVEMNTKDKDLHDSILLKLAGSVLPRLNEIAGEGGEAILLQITGMQIIDESKTKSTKPSVKVSVKKPEAN